MQDATNGHSRGTREVRPQHLSSLSIQSRVIEEVRQRIISGELEPGMTLSEIVLADAFGVSRTPVREALKQLQTEGLVEIRPRVGTFVAAPSRREITELFQIKELLEGGAARLLAQRGNVPELDGLRANLKAADAAVARGDARRYAELVHEFHDLIIIGADNAKLLAHYRTLMNQLAYHRLVHTSLSQPGRVLNSDHEHHHVVELIEAKDDDGAERVMREHVRASHRALMAGLDEADRKNTPEPGATSSDAPSRSLPTRPAALALPAPSSLRLSCMPEPDGLTTAGGSLTFAYT